MNESTTSNDVQTERNIIVSINGKEVKNIPLEDMIKKDRTVKDIVMLEIGKSEEIKAAKQFFVYVNGIVVKPKNVRNVYIENVKTIEIFDKQKPI